MTIYTSGNLPFGGRPYAKLEAVAIGDMVGRDPAGFGDVLLVFDGTVPYLWMADVTGADWQKFALIDVTSGEPIDDNVLTWNSTANAAAFDAIPAQPAPALIDLPDVDVSTPPTDGQVLAYDDGSETWIPTTPSGGGGGGSATASRVQKTIDFDSGGSGNVAITWDVENFDAIGGFALGTDATRFTAPANGVYMHTLMVAAQDAGTSLEIFCNIQIRVNGTILTNFAHWGDNTTKCLSMVTVLTSGQYVDWYVETSNVNIIGDASLIRTFWEVVRLS
jgi:hypothetical protein